MLPARRKTVAAAGKDPSELTAFRLHFADVLSIRYYVDYLRLGLFRIDHILVKEDVEKVKTIFKVKNKCAENLHSWSSTLQSERRRYVAGAVLMT